MKRKSYHNLAWSISQKIINLKRRLCNWRGDGVHSPYAFRFIRNVIRNPHTYEAYRHLYNSHLAQKQKKHFASRVISKRTSLELLFRLVFDFAPQQYYIHSLALIQGHESLSQKYILATGYRNRAEHYGQADLLLVEGTHDGLELDILLGHPPRYMLLIYTQDYKLCQWAKQAKIQLKPPISFKLVGWQIWVWRPQTTSGHYPVYL